MSDNNSTDYHSLQNVLFEVPLATNLEGFYLHFFTTYMISVIID